MVGEQVHPLRRWREERGYTLDAAAAGVLTVRQVWRDWEIGRRLPDRTFMHRLYIFTRGAITADTMHWPFGYPDFETPRLAVEGVSPAPLFDGQAVVQSVRGAGQAEHEYQAEAA
jgi:hypothetical protein